MKVSDFKKKMKRHEQLKVPISAFGVWVFFCLTAGCGGTSEANSADDGERGAKDVVIEQVQKSEVEEVSQPANVEEEEAVFYRPLDNQSVESFLLEFGSETSASEIVMETKFGDVRMRLYDDTPLHRANFLYLIERDYFNPTTIVRVVPDFVIQGGNSEERADQQKRMMIGEYTIPAEFREHHIHKRGALAMSRSYSGNKEKRSSAYDFYIVLGKPLNQATLYTTAIETGRSYSDDQKEIFMQKGGAPHLDNEHTVFGEVISGMSVVEKISRLDRDASDWPREHVAITIKVIE